MTFDSVQYDSNRIGGFSSLLPVELRTLPRSGWHPAWAFSCAVLTPEAITNQMNAEIAAEKAEGEG